MKTAPPTPASTSASADRPFEAFSLTKIVAMPNAGAVYYAKSSAGAGTMNLPPIGVSQFGFPIFP
jgi:hypothetical protein